MASGLKMDLMEEDHRSAESMVRLAPETACSDSGSDSGESDAASALLLNPSSRFLLNTMSVEDYRTVYWPRLEEAIELLLTQSPLDHISISYEQIYSHVYKCVCQQHSELLYQDLLKKITSHLTQISAQLQESPAEDLIENFNVALTQYTAALHCIVPVFIYMSKFYIEAKLNRDLRDDLMKLFCHHVAEKHIHTLLPLLKRASSMPFQVKPSTMASVVTGLYSLRPDWVSEAPTLFARFIPQIHPPVMESQLQFYAAQDKKLQMELSQNGFSRGDQSRKRSILFVFSHNALLPLCPLLSRCFFSESNEKRCLPFPGTSLHSKLHHPPKIPSSGSSCFSADRQTDTRSSSGNSRLKSRKRTVGNSGFQEQLFLKLSPRPEEDGWTERCIMQEDQPMSLAQFFRETYLSETRSRHRHGQSRCSDIHEKTPQKTHFSDPDLSAFLSQEELDKSVDLACKAITDDQDERSDGRHYSVFTSRVTPGTEIISEMKTNLQGKGISKEMDGWHVGVSSREPATETETMLEMPNPVQENPSRKEHRDWDGQHFSTEEMSEKLKVQASRMENTTMMDNHEANECCSNDCSNIIPEQIEVMSGTPIVQQQKANEFTNTFNQINEKTEIRPEMPQTQPLLPQDCNEECDGNHFSLASVGKLTPETEIQPLMQDTIRYGQKEQANGHHFSSSSRKLKSESELLSETQIHQPSLLENAIRNARASRETGQDFRKAQRNPPYGLETQSKKEFLNKAADFIEELSSLFKANSSRRIQPRACKAHRSRYQNKTQPEISAEDRERPVIINPEVKEPIDVRPIISEDLQDPEPLCETLNMIQVQSSEEPVCDRPHFVLKLKSREVQEGSKVQLDCIVRGTPAPEVRWFCEGKELENSPDVQILSSGEHHSLIIAEAFEEDTGRYSCFASNLYGSDSTSAEIYIEGASSSDSDVEQNFQAQFHKRSLQPKPTVNQTSSEDSKSPETSPCSEPSAPSLALAEHVIKPITEYQQEPENSQTLNPEIPQIKITEPLEPEPEETTLLSEGEDGAPPSGQSFSEELLTSQQGLSETFNGSSSSCVQSLDMRPMMEAPVFTKRLQDVLALESQLVVLECRVKGIPSPKVDWYREGMLIEDSPDFRILQKKPRSMAESEEICTLVIAEVFPEDSGTFNCTASNRYGTVSSTAVLTVKGHTNTSTNHENLNPLLLESSAPKFPSIDLKSSSLKRKPEIPTINSKLYSSMISLDPLSSIYKQTDTSDGANSRSDFLNSTAARHDMTTSLPSLDPLSIGKYSSDIFKSRLPTVDSLGFNGSSLSSNSSQSDPCSRFQTLSDSQFDSGGSSFQGSVNVTKNKPNGSVLNISLSSETEPEESRTICIPSVTSSPFVSSNNLQEQVPSKPLPDPPTSCLKTRPERVLGNHNRSRSSSRVGLRVTFKLPEEEEDEEEEEEKGFLSKEPPPVLAKPKLDPAQLQILHNQVLLEQHQDNVSPGQEPSKSDKTNCSDQPTIPIRNKPAPSPMSPPPIIDTKPPFSSIVPSSTQSFNYARPKEFRSPSPTESPVPMLHELAAQLFPKSSRDLTSPVNQPGRRFPTRVLESPSSPPYVSSPPPLFSAGLMNSVFSFRPQSPPQAPSPTSSGSSPSPIQNPVAFLSSVLPSLPTAPATNAMGLPKRAPQGPQGTQKKVQRGSRIFSEEEIRNSKELLLLDMERKVQFKDDHLPLGQQKLNFGGDYGSRALEATATVINYDEEYKVSSFEQRLMSEIEFRLERTPVEESDDDVQHDEIPTGKCIAPIFDRKLKHFRAVYWFKDGKQILKKNDHYQKIREGDGTCSLHIESVTSDDDGNYTVMAANPQGRISCSGHLIVQTGPVRNRPVVPSQRVRARVQEVEGEPTQQRFFRPHFLQAPGDTQAHEGKLCRLDCKVSGLPHPEIMWLLNGKPIYPDETHRLLVRENGVHSLLLDPLSQADDGTYTCIASNKAGQSSFCLQLTVLEKELKQAPRFLEKLQNCGLAEGAPARLECRVLGTPRPLIYWKKDNDTIPHSTDRVSMHQDSTGYVCLLIQPSRKDDAGWYTVSAKNEAGIVSCTARLDIYAQWHQHVHPPMRKAGMSGSRYAALSGLGLDVKSAFPSSENVPPVFSKESEEL
ncbi:hypothetical protein DNTS_009880 [Danionella cerebrum]|uniref:Myopalladin n=1 Tax=Danionella cerebrum TaxID=2873325 RepID=A0A553NJR1_9TELE|nr:hypothetical protein DNTS_009880 [Danionella translucida]